MSKNTFVLVMIVETFAALVSAGLLFNEVGAVIYPIALAVYAAVLAPFFLWLKREPEETKKRKIRLWMTLVMLLPIAAGLAAFLAVVVVLFIYFGF